MRLTTLAVCALLVPAPAFAQAAMAGVVTDPAGAVVPGVRVEASSPALIERTRDAVTDRSGRYLIAELRPGIYTVRFTAKGFDPLQRAGIELAGTLTVTVDAQFLPTLHEAVDVVRESPVIDLYNPRRETTVAGESVRAIPTARSYNALLPLIPGVVTNTNDTVTGTASTSFPIYGGRIYEGRLLLDGLNVGSPPSGNSGTSYIVDVGAAQDVTFTVAGASGEIETAGLVMNIISKAGGNDVHGSVFGSGTGARLQSDNLTPTLLGQGVAAVTPLARVYDLSGTIGGPIRQDLAWYFVNAHTGGSTRNSANVYYNLNAGDPAKWLYAPDYGRPEYSDRTFENAGARLTWQVTPRNKVGLYVDDQSLCRKCTGATPGGSDPPLVSPEAVGVLSRPFVLTQASWLSTISDRLLLDAAFGGSSFGVGNFQRQPNPTLDLVRVVEQCASGCAANGNIPGLTYRSQDFSSIHTSSYLAKASLARITGTHSLRVGYQHTSMADDRTWFTNNQNLTYRVSNGVPNQLTQSISPWVNDTRVAWDAVYVQNQWTPGRVTIQGALRFDRATSRFPEQQEGPSRFLPTPITIPETRGVDSYKDLSPRAGVTIDVFGDRRTALKIQAGKYLEGAGTIGNYANSNPSLRMPQTTQPNGTPGVTRSWIDANSNFAPDCDLLNSAMQDRRASGGDFCGPVSDSNFGRNVLVNNFAPDVLNGWGVRPSDRNLFVSLQKQLRSRSSIEVSYVRRWYRGFLAVDNLAVAPSDFTPFTVTAPFDTRLPNGGGYAIAGLYDVSPEKAGQVNNLVAKAGEYGDWSQSFAGVDANVQVRGQHGFIVIAGVSAGETVSDSCDVRARLPELSTSTTGTSTFGAGLLSSSVTPVSPYCHVSTGMLPQIRGLSAYLVPKIDVQVAAAFQSKAGAMLVANYVVPNAAVVPSLGRSLSGNAANVTVNLIAPGSMYGDRINQFDVRLAKTIKVARTQTTVGLEMYNALNSSAVLTYNASFVPGGTWPAPASILAPRLFKVTAEMTF
jgi:hypothetical protein